MRLPLYQGDITDERANEWLQHGAGVAGAIVRKGGRQIQDESNRITSRYGPVNVGKAVYTIGGMTRCWSEVERPWQRAKHEACLESLHVAAELGVCSIAFSAISSGIFGMPKDICAHVQGDGGI